MNRVLAVIIRCNWEWHERFSCICPFGTGARICSAVCYCVLIVVRDG